MSRSKRFNGADGERLPEYGIMELATVPADGRGNLYRTPFGDTAPLRNQPGIKPHPHFAPRRKESIRRMPTKI